MDEKKQFLQYLQERDNIYLYGAGEIAKRILFFCRRNSILINGIIVSDKGGNPKELDGIRIWAWNDVRANTKMTESMNIIVSVGAALQKEILDVLAESGVKSIYFLSVKLRKALQQEVWREKYCWNQGGYMLVTEHPKRDDYAGIIVEACTHRPVFRIMKQEIMEMPPERRKFCTYEAFKQDYGDIAYLPHGDAIGVSEQCLRKCRLEIYIVTSHLDEMRPEDINMGGYIPLQVGAALTSLRKNCLRDNTGIQISDKNVNYCECTGLYWIWKNTSGQDYVGLSHYRRRLMIDDSSVDYLRTASVDVVTTLPNFVKKSIKEFFWQYNISHYEWKLLKEKVCAYHPDLPDVFERYENSSFFFPCNIFLWKREWFDRYCEFAFSVAEEIEQVFEEKGIYKEDRYMGYLFENMSSIFLMWHWDEMNIAYSEMEWIG